MRYKPRLIELIQRAAEEERAFVANLTDQERAASSALEHWSAKDVLAHLATWREWEAHSLEAVARGETPSNWGEIDQTNADIFDKNRHLAWPDVLALWERALGALLQRLQVLSEADLLSTQFLPWQEGRPLWRLIVGNSYAHPIAHLAQYYAEHGQVAHATRLQEGVAAALILLDDNPAWQGVVRYNLACYYALAGDQEKAIAGLREALRLNPDLTEWSKQDSDLASLRGEAAYQALYVNAPARSTDRPG